MAAVRVCGYESGNRRKGRAGKRSLAPAQLICIARKIAGESVIYRLSLQIGPRHGVDLTGASSYTVTVKNITVSVDEETYRRARSKAAERDTSLSALVKKFLVELVSEESAERSLERQERDLRAQIRDFSAGDRLSREDAHRRRSE
jgi:hypothetical protein